MDKVSAEKRAKIMKKMQKDIIKDRETAMPQLEPEVIDFLNLRKPISGDIFVILKAAF